jgi:hypothetical protein
MDYSMNYIAALADPTGFKFPWLPTLYDSIKVLAIDFFLIRHSLYLRFQEPPS